MNLKDKEVVFDRKMEYKKSLLDVHSNCFGHIFYTFCRAWTVQENNATTQMEEQPKNLVKSVKIWKNATKLL